MLDSDMFFFNPLLGGSIFRHTLTLSEDFVFAVDVANTCFNPWHCLKIARLPGWCATPIPPFFVKPTMVAVFGDIVNDLMTHLDHMLLPFCRALQEGVTITNTTFPLYTQMIKGSLRFAALHCHVCYAVCSLADVECDRVGKLSIHANCVEENDKEKLLRKYGGWKIGQQ
jgi:hypothetical protein